MRQRNITTCFSRKPKLKLRGEWFAQVTASKVSEDKARYVSSGLSALFTVHSKDNDDIKRIKQKDRIQIISSYSSKESRNVLISVTTLSLKGKKNNLTKCTRDILLIRNNQLVTQYWDKCKWQWFDNLSICNIHEDFKQILWNSEKAYLINFS